MTPRPKAYSYLRYSTPEQGAGDSTRRQLQAARDYATTHGLDLDESLHLQDTGVSGFRGKNSSPDGALGAFLASVKAGDVAEGSFLLVENLDRLSRQSARKAARVLEDLCDAGVAVVTLMDRKVYTAELFETDDLAFPFLIFSFMRAHDESRTKSRRIKESWTGRLLKAKQGQPITKTCPGWLELEGEKHTGTIRKVPARVAIVRRIFREALKGVGQHSIAEGLNRDHVPTFGRGLYWHRAYIRKVLNNPAVLGVFVPYSETFDKANKPTRTAHPKDQRIKNYYPAIISSEDFKRVQVLMTESRAPLRGRHAKAGQVNNLFASLGRCGRCGGSLTTVRKVKGIRSLVCTRAKVGAGCQYESVRYEQAEQAFTAGSSYLFAHMPTGDRGEEIDAGIGKTETEVEACNDALTNLLTLAETGGQSPTISNRIREIETTRDTLREHLDSLYTQRETATRKYVKLRVSDLKLALAASPLNRTTANALLRQVFSAVTIDFERGTLRLTWRHGGESEITFAWPTAAKGKRATKAKAGKT